MIYTAYYDASGHQASKIGVLTALGLVAGDSQWKRYEDQWEAMLGDFGVPYFHMKDYTVSRGPYADWKGDEEKRAAFLKTAIKILKANVTKVFSGSVILKEFNRVNRYFVLSETYGRPGVKDHGAYPICATICKKFVMDWKREKRPHEQIGHVFEKGDVGQKSFKAYVEDNEEGYAGEVSFVCKHNKEDGSRVRQFEGADLVAWEYRNLLANVEERGLIPDRVSLGAIRTMLPAEGGVHDESSLVKLCEGYPQLFPPRERS